MRKDAAGNGEAAGPVEVGRDAPQSEHAGAESSGRKQCRHRQRDPFVFSALPGDFRTGAETNSYDHDFRDTVTRAKSERLPMYQTALRIARLRMCGEDVAFAASRVNQTMTGAGVELGAQPLDIDVDHVGEGVEAL